MKNSELHMTCQLKKILELQNWDITLWGYWERVSRDFIFHFFLTEKHHQTIFTPRFEQFKAVWYKSKIHFYIEQKII